MFEYLNRSHESKRPLPKTRTKIRVVQVKLDEWDVSFEPIWIDIRSLGIQPQRAHAYRQRASSGTQVNSPLEWLDKHAGAPAL
jgi:hypothetical protein